MPGINIPIYEIELDGVKIPISVAYHAGGFKVDEGSSHVGLGWALNAGGMINNMGVPQKYEVMKLNYKPTETSTATDGYGNSWTWNTDGTAVRRRNQSPKRYVNAPGLEFRFWGDTTPIVQDPPMSLARRDTLLGNDLWITNEHGVRYRFRADEFHEYKYVPPLPFNEPVNPSLNIYDMIAEKNPSYSSPDKTSYLKEIITLHGQNILFEHDEYSMYNTGGFNESIFFPRNQVSPFIQKRDGGILPIDDVGRFTSYATSRIRKIAASNGIIVEFNYGEFRKDVPADMMLKSILVYHIKNGQRIVLKTVKFYQSYFDCKYQGEVTPGDIPGSVFHRLRLDSLEIGSGAVYEPEKYKFEYNENDLPEKGSFSQDIWGYYNAAPNLALMPQRTESVGPAGRSLTYSTPIVNRLADSLAPLSAVLKKITYPTGGTTSYEYEINRVETNPYHAELTYNGIPFGDNKMDFPITPRSLPIDMVGTERDDQLFRKSGPFFFSIRSFVKVNGVYGKNVSFIFRTPPATDAGPFSIEVTAVAGGGVFGTNPNGTPSFLPNGIYKFYVTNTAEGTSWDWAICQLTIREPASLANPITMAPYNYRGPGIRVKKITDYDGKDHLNDMVRSYKYHQFTNPARSSGRLSSENGGVPGKPYSTDELDVVIPRYVYDESPFAVTAPIPTSQYVMSNVGTPSNPEYVGGRQEGNGVIYFDNRSYVIPIHQTYDIVSAATGYPGGAEIPVYVGYSNVTEEFGEDGIHGKKEYTFTNSGQHWQRGQRLSERTYKKMGSTYTLVNTDSTIYAIDNNWVRATAVISKTQGNIAGNPLVTSSSWMGYDIPYLPSPTWTKTLNSVKDTLMTVSGFAASYPGITGTENNSEAIKRLNRINALTQLVETSSFLIPAGTTTPKLVSSKLNTYRKNATLVDTTFEIENDVASTAFHKATVVSGKFVRNKDYVVQEVATRYGPAGNLLEGYKPGFGANAYIWDYNNTYPVAIVVNADSLSIAYTSFETSNHGNWVITGGQMDPSNAQTGSGSYKFLTGGSICKTGLPTTNKYLVTYWSRNGTLTGAGTLKNSEAGWNGWVYYEHELAAGSSSVCLTGNNIAVDELRLYPENSAMSTQAFEPFVGVVSQCTPDNRITHFRYDPLGRLQFQLDADRSIIKVYEYNYISGAAAGL
ncbi:hypothetical protein [Chitinophaga barathri]|nr:hypothetical protein [Chitinophaga barathri]